MRILKRLAIFLVVFVLLLVACIPIASTSRPEGTADPRADLLAKNMQEAVNVEAWNNTRFVKWSFLGQHDFLWDKFSNTARVSWGKYIVYIDGGSLEGKAYKKGEELAGEEKEKVMTKATENFFNDAFWLNAPSKVFDNGVERTLVDWKGEEGLLVTYTSGGLTPGDAYLWLFDEDDSPRAWKMWVDILPVKGLGNSWEGWETLYSGARISTVHKGGPFSIKMIRDLQAGNNLSEIGEEEDALATWRF
jgi:hypothetical protein